jgi:glycerol-3-phosphate dehydrogenase (NAD(P)+)
MNQTVGFVGAGRWALALALRLQANGCRVALWEKDAAALARFAAGRGHPDLPLTDPVPESIIVSGNVAEALSQAETVVFATPSAVLAEAARLARPHLSLARTIVTVTKGLDPQTFKRMSVVLKEALWGLPVVVLAGPGIPFDMVRGDPTSLVAASETEAAAETVRDLFTGANLRVYSHGDVVGVELGAALKNVIAIAAGVVDGLGLGINAKAALLTRGLAEVTRLGMTMNTNPMTYSGLSGMGDLIVTAFSENSRNRTLGYLIGRGASTAEAQARLNGVAEGAVTCRSARALAAKQNVELPIAEEVYRIVHEAAPPRESLTRLLRRKPKPEVWQ